MAVSKVVVVDGNNLIVRIDRGVAGRGVTDVQPVEIDNQLFLEFTFSDGTTETVGPVGTIQYIGQSPIVINGPTISLSTVPVNLGGTGQTTANAGFNALAPSQAPHAGKYLKTDGTNTSWDALDISTADITGTLPIANGGTNATTAADARTNLNAADQATTISAGTGLSGGGSLAANRTIDIANTSVTAGSYGSASDTLSATVNAQGQLTALAATPIAVANTQISGLGTMSTQNASSVAITGGSITGITDLAVADGGTGASDAAGARTNLNAANQATTITAGTGLSGGGDLSANRTLSITNTAVTAGSFGSASNTLTATVNAQGQLTALAATPIAIANTQVSGLGTASVLNAGVALGVATLDAGGTVPLSQIPASIQGGVSYQGSWDASTNTPTLVSSVGSKGYYYVVSVAGSTNLNGITDWLPGDWAIYNGTAWEKIDNTDSVASVNGYVGAVVLNAADVGAPPTTRSISTGTGLTGGGNLSADRTISIDNTAVSAGSYGSASAVGTFTVNAQGQLTAASNTTIAIANTQVSGLGTMSTQNANAVAITGGSVNGTTIGATTPSTVTGTTVTATTLVVNDNSTLGSSNSDTVSFNARVNSDIDPSTNNTYDLGRNSHAWRNLYLTGTANIAALSASGTTTLSGLTASTALALNASKQVVSVVNTGTGDNVLATSPTLVTPNLGTPSTLVGTNITGTAAGLTAGNVTTNANLTGAVTSVGNATSLGSFSSANLAAAVTDETGTGALVFANSPTLVTPALGTPASGVVTNLTGTASININGTVGATTANTGAFTTLAASGAVTLSGGTANGVSFLNASKVLTTGSALTFDGTNLGVGVSTVNTFYQRTLQLNGADNASLKLTNSNTSGTAAGDGFEVLLSGTEAYLNNRENGPIIFNTNAAEQMRLTSTGLGIGTSSPNASLQVSGNAFVGVTTTGGIGVQTGLTVVGGANVSANNPGILTLGSHLNTRVIGDQIGTINFFSNDASGGASGVQASIRGITETSIGDAAGLHFYTGTSSALLERMRITSAGNVGIGTSSPTNRLSVSGSANITGDLSLGNTGIPLVKLSGVLSEDRGFSISAANASTVFLEATQSPVSVNLREVGLSGSGVIFATGATSGTTKTERMRIDSAGNVGIGMVPGAYMLDLNGTMRLGGASGGIHPLLSRSGTTGGLIINTTAASAGGPLIVQDNGTERLRIDSSGNLGLGVTPSAWLSSVKALQITSALSLFGNGANNAIIGNNWYLNSSDQFIYNSSIAASYYRQLSGAHSWHTAPSGTAGNAISFTQAMTLDASGQLLVGTTTAASRVTVNLSGAYDGITLRTTNEGPIGLFGMVAPGTNNDIAIGTLGANNLRFFTNGTANERARITSGGNFGIGTTSPTVITNYRTITLDGTTGSILDLRGNGTLGARIVGTASSMALETGGATPMSFWTNDAERARITSGGDLIQTVNTTAATLTTNQTLTFSIVDNSTLRISVRGSDGTTRTATVALT
jgi:hypothetical protein